MRLSPWRRIFAPKDKRKIVYAMTMLEAFWLDTFSRRFTVPTVWLTNPPQSSQIRPRPRRGITDFPLPEGANKTILIRSWDGRSFIPRGASLQAFARADKWRRLQPVGV